MLDEKTAHVYNIIMSIFLAICIALLANFMFNKKPAIEIEYPKIITNQLVHNSVN
jgi:hypothetical protein